MRHPTTGLSEDDLSRLTGSSSSTASCSSHSSCSSSSSPSTTPSHNEQQQLQTDGVAIVATATARDKDNQLTTTTQAIDSELLKNLKNSSHTHEVSGNDNQKTANNNNNNSHFNSSYLPEFIDPLDWQRSRKRKERLDSTSSTTPQDRKLIRSNSADILPNEAQPQRAKDSAVPCVGTALKHKQTSSTDVIRRVSSEDFKRSPYCLFDLRSASADAAVLDPAAKAVTATHGSDENDASVANRQPSQQQTEPLSSAYSETLVNGPTKDMTRRSRYETSPARSPSRNNGGGAGGKYQRDSDDSECEHERRRSSERFCKSRVPPGRKAAGVMKKSGKYLPTKKRGDENAYKYDVSALKYERRGFVSKKPQPTTVERGNADHNDNNLIDFHIIRNGNGEVGAALKQVSPVSPPTVAESANQSASTSPTSSNIRKNIAANATTSSNTTSADALPWENSTIADQTEPVLSRRYATVRPRPSDCTDTAAKLSKVMPYPQQFHKQAPAQLMADECLEPLNTFRAFTSLENIKTRDVMQQVIPAMKSFQSPEERLKQVNKRLTALKKKLVQFEESFETKLGYRPSQAEKLNDKYMKNVLAEISKLRKEKHELKSDSMGAMGFKVSGGMDGFKKLEKIMGTLNEIEQNLSDKREDANRSDTLEELAADQLLQEKSAVQHGLLYFESLYGRPSTKDERDAARPLYDRYRQLKRLVSRSVALSGCAAAGAPELPTILEHEAMVFESMPQPQYSSNNSSDSTPSPSESMAANTITASNVSSDDSTTTTTGNPAVDTNENISSLSIDQLWEQLDKTRDEKKLLKSTIREYETVFEEQNGRKMQKSDRKIIEETYAQYKEKKGKTRLLQALIKKHISR